jgi:hypothetical protein
MEDDVLHFSEGVLVDDAIELGLVGIVALREDRQTVIIWSVSKSARLPSIAPSRYSPGPKSALPKSTLRGKHRIINTAVVTLV